jgi:hypothetical protein
MEWVLWNSVYFLECYIECFDTGTFINPLESTVLFWLYDIAVKQYRVTSLRI